MLAILPTGHLDPLVEIGTVSEPVPAVDEVLVQVEAFSLNRGETFLLGGRAVVGDQAATLPVGSFAAPPTAADRRSAPVSRVIPNSPAGRSGQPSRPLPSRSCPTRSMPSPGPPYPSPVSPPCGSCERPGPWLGCADIPVARDFDALVALVARGRLHPEIGVVADWTQTASVSRTSATATSEEKRYCASTPSPHSPAQRQGLKR